MIWKRIPKDTFVKRTQFEIGVYDSVAHFNTGNLATLLIYDKSNIERGYYTVLDCTEDNKCRMKNAKRLSSDKLKSRRRFLRGKRKSKGDKIIWTSGILTFSVLLLFYCLQLSNI